MKTLLIAILICCIVGFAVPAHADSTTYRLRKELTSKKRDYRNLKTENTRQQKTIKSQTKEIATLKKDINKLNIVKTQNVKYVRQNRLLVQYVKELRLFILDKLGVEALDSIAPPKPKSTTKPRPRTQPRD